jgi:nuclear cap-binding protein subunit 1
MSGASEAHSHVWLQDVLEKIVRLSYWDRIRKTLPDEFAALMPPKVAPVLKYAAEREGTAEAKQLEQRMREKTVADAVLALVRDEWGAKLAEDEKLDIVLHCVLSLGAKSFSHLLNTVERYLPLLRALVTSAASRLATLRAVHDFWQNSPQHLLIIADKLMTYRLVDHFSIVAFLFSPELHPALRKYAALSSVGS